MIASPDLKPLPLFQPIEVANIPPASVLLFYGGPKITEWYGNYRYGHPYRPPAFHASVYLEEGQHFTVGKFKVIRDLDVDLRTTRRVDVVICKELTDNDRHAIVRECYHEEDRPKIGFNLPTYGFWDFLRFEPALQWLPKSSRYICSEHAYVRFAAHGSQIATKPNKVEVAPWMILEHALKNPSIRDVRTVWVGEDFTKKYGG